VDNSSASGEQVHQSITTINRIGIGSTTFMSRSIT
jgi:hypothetical protein